MKTSYRFATGTVALLMAAGIVSASNFVSSPITVSTNGGGGLENAISNAVPANTTNIIQSVVIPCADYNTLGFTLLTKLDAAGTAPIDYYFTGTVNGTNYSTAIKRKITVTPAGTITVNTVTNLDCTGFQNLKLTEIDNGNAGILTNQVLDLGYKRAKDLNPGF